MAAPRYSICIPYEPDGSTRDMILRWTIARWRAICPQAEIVTAGDGGGPLRNRSRMRNRCAAKATTDTLLFVDADCLIFSVHEIDTILDLLPGAGMVQYHAVSRLTLAQSTAVVRQQPGSQITLPDGAGFTHAIVGGFFAMTRAAYESVGGFDERFVGWGGEDPALQRAVRTLAGPIRTVPYLLYHLYHPQEPEHDTSTARYQRTLAHFKLYERADGKPEEMRALIGHGFTQPAGNHIIGCQDNYPPMLNAGAEQSFRALMLALRDAGYDVTVVTRAGYPGDSYDGIPVVSSPNWEQAIPALLPARAIISGHNANLQVARIAQAAGVPCFSLIHNDMDPAGFAQLEQLGARVIANSQWVAEKIGLDDFLHPLIRQDLYQTSGEGTAVTLINLSENKGGRLFWELARRMPATPFLAVKGAYEQQIVPEELPANVTLIDTTEDMRSVYARTRILLMPSRYESYGRCALEAAASGIPTIAHPTPGLQEALGDAGTFCNRDDAGAWQSAIEYLASAKHYARQAKRSRQRFDAVQRADAHLVSRLLAQIADCGV